MPTDDYILRSDALKAILGVSIYDTIEELEGARTITENTWADGLYDAYKIIEEDVDTVDVVPAPVHCSDCRFYDKRDGGAPGGTGWCSRPGAGCGVPEEFFCAGAERKENSIAE